MHAVRRPGRSSTTDCRRSPGRTSSSPYRLGRSMVSAARSIPSGRWRSRWSRDGTLYYQESSTPYGPYPYPLEMRFGVRSVTKSVFAPLALLHLAQFYGPWVLALHVGDYVPGLDPKWRRIRFIDAANMATGFGGTGTTKTHPNDVFDGYLGGDYDAWYTAPSHAEKIRQINLSLHPYPWEPGTVMRYRDQDYYLLGAAIEGFLKSVRGPRSRPRRDGGQRRSSRRSASITPRWCARGRRTAWKGLSGATPVTTQRSMISRKLRCSTRRAARRAACRSSIGS